MLREGIITSERVCALSWQAEVLYRRLMSAVDDFGRYYGTPMMIRAACFPTQLDRVKDGEIEKWLQESVAVKLLRIYDVDGKPYVEMIDFRQQIRAKKSKFPDPVNGVDHPSVIVAAKTKETIVLVDDSPVVERLPLIGTEFFDVTENFINELEPLYPKVDVPATIREMKGWLIGNPTRRKTKAGIRRFITKWLARENEKHGA